jgi:O-antigen/teichoic acid export membrane protein
MTSATFSSGRVARALASTIVSQGLTIAQTYLLVPLYLAAWGSEGYGRWLSLTALAAYIALADFGGQIYVGNRLAEAFALQQREQFIALLQRGFSVFTTFSVIALAITCGVLLAPALKLSLDSKLVVFFYAIDAALAVSGGVLVTCYAATGRVVRSVNFASINRIVTILVSMGGLLLRFDQPRFAALLLGISLLTTTGLVWDLRRQLPELFRPRFSLAALRAGVPLLRESLHYWLFSLASALSLQGVVLALSMTNDGATVAAYSTHRSGASLVAYAAALLKPALWTELTFLAARADFARIRELVSVAVRANVWLASVMGSALCLAAPFAYATWTRSKLELDMPLLALLIGQAVLAAGWSAASWPLMSASRPRSLARWTVANAALTVAGGYALLRAGFGLRGFVVWSLAVDLVCGLVPFPIAAYAFLQGRVSAFFIDMARALACAVPFMALAFSCAFVSSDERVRIAVFTAISCILAWPTLYALFGGRELARIVSALRRAAGLS